MALNLHGCEETPDFGPLEGLLGVKIAGTPRLAILAQNPALLDPLIASLRGVLSALRRPSPFKG